MESKIKIATKKVTTGMKCLRSSLEKKNSRLVQKYVLQLKDSIEGLIQATVTAEVEGVSEQEEYIIVSNRVADEANELLLETDEYLLDVEKNEEDSIINQVSEVKLKDLFSLLTTFKDSLKIAAEELVVEMNMTERNGSISKIIDKRKEQMEDYQNQKLSLVGKSREDSQQKLDYLYQNVAQEFDAWIESAVKYCGKSQSIVSAVSDSKPPKARGPGLKIDRLVLPVFRGNVRHFARFCREFDDTVGSQYSDGKIKLMYLQNQCLSGPAKESVRNLTDFDEAMGRLKERYGKVRTVVDIVLRDISQAKLPEDEPNRTIALASLLEMAWDDIIAIDALDEYCNVVTLGTIETKLPPRLQIIWAQEKSGSSRDAMVNLKIFIEKQRKIAEEVLAMRGKGVLNEGSANRYGTKDRGTPSDNKKYVNALSLPEKRRGCYRCGFTNHIVKDCKVPATLKCRRCQRQGHIENACPEPPPTPVSNQQNNVSSRNEKFTGVKTVLNTNHETDSNVRLPIETINTSEGSCLVLWDSGSMLNLVSSEWISATGLQGKECELEYKVVDSSVKAVRTKLYNIQLVTRSGEKQIIKAYEIESLAAYAKKLDKKLLHTITNQCSVQLDKIDNSSGKVQLLLGSGCAGLFPETEFKNRNLCLMTSRFGVSEYFVAGGEGGLEETHIGTVSNVQYVRVTPLHNICMALVAQLDEYKRDFVSVEELGIRPPPICKTCKNCETCKPASQFLSLKEYRELNVIKSKLSYDEHAKVWTAGYPFLRDPSVLKDNYETTLKVLIKRENKLMKDETLKRLYSEQIEDFVSRGVIRKMSDKELENWTGPIRYVDHREVYKEGSTTPVRIVINSSFRDKNELSLNDILMKGPNVLTNLLEILIRWRLHPVGFVADIAKMYHNVKTGQLEANVRRLLWRNYEQERPPDVYCFEVVTFGDRPAGCIAVSALKATADMFSSDSEQAADVLKEDTYMDDVVSGESTTTDAKVLTPKIEAIAAKGGFKFKKFTYSGEIEDNGEKKSMEKVLGITWSPSDDTIKVTIVLNHNKRKKGLRSDSVDIKSIPFTRRICLRLINGIYDPLGMFCPVTVRLKILMQEQFVKGTKYNKWDTLLEPQDRIEWIKLLHDVLKLNEFEIPRHPLEAPFPVKVSPGKFTLVCFADASIQAMCAAVYLRHESVIGEVSVGLLTAKTKVAPAKKETLPRLELCASLLGSRLSEKVVTAVTLGKEVMERTEQQDNSCFEAKYILLDSKIALGTLNKGSLSNDFTGNCVSEIRGKTENTVFAWVKSEDNVADLGTRGISPEKVRQDSVWQKGPSWLYEPIENWPIEVMPLEELPIVGSLEETAQVINIDKFSDIGRLHKHTALCLKFANSRGNGKTAIDSDWKRVKLTPEDYERAEQFWIKRVSESVSLMYNSGKLQSLRPSLVWDERGHFLKVVTSGRLGNLLKIGYDVEELTILDPKHPYTRLVLKDCHDSDHGGDDRAVWKSRNKFWIPQARKIVKTIRSQCYRCKLLAKRNAGQLMAPLPADRVLPTPVWTHTSIDLFGPLEHVDMVRKRLKEKCWGVIFTCMVSRAVHLDLTQAYHTDALLQVLRRFMAIRGTPQKFLSDQWTQLQ